MWLTNDRWEWIYLGPSMVEEKDGARIRPILGDALAALNNRTRLMVRHAGRRRTHESQCRTRRVSGLTNLPGYPLPYLVPGRRCNAINEVFSRRKSNSFGYPQLIIIAVIEMPITEIAYCYRPAPWLGFQFGLPDSFWVQIFTAIRAGLICLQI
jgi:hypothetical protein